MIYYGSLEECCQICVRLCMVVQGSPGDGLAYTWVKMKIEKLILIERVVVMT